MITIVSKQKQQKADFSISYETNDHYAVKNWKCSSQPKVLPSFTDFKKAAEVESPEHIVQQTAPQGWDSLLIGDLSKIKTEVNTDVVTVTLLAISQKEIAKFSATYVNDFSYSIKDWKCIVQPKAAPSFNDFKKAADDETPEKIVAQTKPNGWDSLPSSDLSVGYKGNTDSTVVVQLKSSSKNQIATFVATYTTNIAYNINDWKCSIQPDTTKHSFDEFKAAAEKATAVEIVANASPAANNWNNLPKGDLKIDVPTVTNNSVSISILSESRHERAMFEIDYQLNMAYSVKNWKCSKQPYATAHTFAEFTKAAEAESPSNIVNNAKASGWDNLPANDLSKVNTSIVNDSIIIKLLSKTKQQTAIFTATYKTNELYNVNEWVCSSQPRALPTFTDFKKAAEAETLEYIVIQTQPNDWDGLPTNDLVKIKTVETNNSVILTIKSKSKGEVAVFTATYTNNIAYNLKDWKCSVQPSKLPTFQDFKKAAEAELLTNIVAQTKPKGWNNLPQGDLVKNVTTPISNAIKIDIFSKSKKEIATFSATYIQDTAYVITDWKCSIQPHIAPTFNDFTKAANKETAFNIIVNAMPEADGWNVIKDPSDVSIIKSNNTTNSVVVTIKSKSLDETAIFTATYVVDQKYKVSDWGCSAQPSALPTFNNFKKAAEAESLINIIQYANPSAKGWDKLSADDLSKGDTETNNNTISIVIKSTSPDESATFSATYTKDVAYSVDDWKCSSQPTKTKHSFKEFQAAAEAATAYDIVQNATTPAAGWKGLKAGDLTITKTDSTSDTVVVVTIKSTTKGESAQFSATYVQDEKYNLATDWKCSLQPKHIPTWDDFQTKAKAESLINIVKNANAPAKGWSLLKASDLSPGDATGQNPYFTIEIKSTSLDQTATFRATYTLNKTYDLASCWACSIQPTHTKHSFDDFTTAATNESAINIVKNAPPANGKWKDVTKDNLKKGDPQVDTTAQTVTVEITNTSSLGEVATFIATYVQDEKYNLATDWKCSIQPHPPKWIIISNNLEYHKISSQIDSVTLKLY